MTAVEVVESLTFETVTAIRADIERTGTTHANAMALLDQVVDEQARGRQLVHGLNPVAYALALVALIEVDAEREQPHWASGAD